MRIRGGSSSGSSSGSGLKCFICVGSICLNETTCSNSEDSCIKSFAGEKTNLSRNMATLITNTHMHTGGEIVFKGCGLGSTATNCDDAGGTGIGTCACSSDLCNGAPSPTNPSTILCLTMFLVWGAFL